MRRTLLPGLLLAGALAALSSVAAAPVHGQGYRARLDVGGSLVELRGLVRDSVPEGQVEGDGLRRRLDDGTVVTCIPGGFCHWYRPGDIESLAPLTQRLTGAAWGEIQGLSLHVDLRGRVGSDGDWPFTDQRIEAAEAYLRLIRDDFRVRAGRQYRSDGLGFRNFDGLSLTWSGLEAASFTVFGGWGLAPFLNAPRTGDLLDEAEAIPPVKRGLLMGVEAAGRIGDRVSGRAVYQREMRTDGAALYSERIAVDGRALLEPLTLSAALEYDVALDEFNEGRLSARIPVTDRVEARMEYRHYTPFFELWTIWGAFSPVGFDEARAGVGVELPSMNLNLDAGGAYRWYEGAAGGAEFVPLRDDGWRATLGGRWADDAWFVAGGYRAEAGPGAARFGGDVAVGRRFGSESRVTLRGLSTQTFGEFRLGERYVTGGGIDGTFRAGHLRLNGGAGLYSLEEQETNDSDWTQFRAHLGVSYVFGSEPEPPVPHRSEDGER